MKQQPPIEVSKALLRAAGVPFRLRMEGTPTSPKSRWVNLYRTTDSRSLVVKGLAWDDREGVERATQHLLNNARKSLETLRAELLELTGSDASEAVPVGVVSWGAIRALVKEALAPGGEKEKDPNPFAAFKDRGFFGLMYADSAIARTQDLEQWCRYTPASIQAHQRDSSLPLVPRRYGSSVFLGCVQAVNWLARKKVPAASPELVALLEELKQEREEPNPDFIPRDEDIAAWLEQVSGWDPVVGWLFAMVATYGLRPHEVWHITRLPGEVEGDPTLIQVGIQTQSRRNRTTKTGHRFADALPTEWLSRFRLNDRQHAQAMLRSLKTRWKGNNRRYGTVVSHLMYDSHKPDRCVPWRLMGYYRPDPTEAVPRPKEKKGRATAYDLRHRWALRCLELSPHWSTELKAELMGHSPAIHEKTYLRSVTEAQKLARLSAWKKEAESRAKERGASAPLDVDVVVETPAEPADDVAAMREEIERLRKLNAKQKRMLDAAIED